MRRAKPDAGQMDNKDNENSTTYRREARRCAIKEKGKKRDDAPEERREVRRKNEGWSAMYEKTQNDDTPAISAAQVTACASVEFVADYRSLFGLHHHGFHSHHPPGGGTQPCAQPVAAEMSGLA